ncbi:MAG: hypothetical protein OEW05_13960 [Candidatus Aminicenantes bacterium]|nr:hypothetical protein [Candidatus Aminicenantes bacterium]
MRKILTLFPVLMLTILVSAWGAERTTTLQVETRLFATAPEEPAGKEKGADPDIVVFARLFKPGLGRGAAGEAESLKRFFNLTALALREEARTAEITWSEDEKTKKGRLTVDRRVQLKGCEFLVVLVPEEVNGPQESSLFRLEIHRAAEGQSGPVDVLEKILAKDISWNFYGPLVLGFFFPDEAYFLTVAVQAKKSSFGGRLGASISWTL